MLWTALGIGCVLYTAREVMRAWPAGLASAGFGAVDATSGRPLEVTLDRRTRGRRSSDG